MNKMEYISSKQKLSAVIFGFALILLGATNVSLAKDITLTWDANKESDVAFYNVYFKDMETQEAWQEPGPAHDPTANIISQQILGLDGTRQYCFQVTAQDASSVESPPSQEVCTLVASVDTDGDGLIDSVDPQPDVYNSPLDDDTAFIRQVYLDFLNREPEIDGLKYWVDQLDAGLLDRSELIEQYLNSAEFGLKVSPVARLYFAYFNRLPDYDGLMYWVGEFGLGAPLGAVSEAFAESPEFISTHGSLNNEAFVNLVYHNVLGRNPEADGLAYWIGELDAGRATRGQVMTGFSESDEYQNWMHNPVYVTMTYISLLRRVPELEGFNFWVGAMDGGASGLGLIEGFLSSDEFAARFTNY